MNHGSPVEQRKPSRRTCEHCGSPFLPIKDEAYCCNGCAHVARLINEDGLTQFYRDKAGITQPVNNTPFERHDWQPIIAATRNRQHTSNQLELEIQGMVCRACAWLVEQIIQRESPTFKFSIDVETRRIRFTWPDGSQPEFETLGQALQDYGYLLQIPDKPKAAPPSPLSLALAGAFAISAFILLTPRLWQIDQGLSFSRLFALAGTLAAVIAALIAGHYLIRLAKHLRR